MKRVILVVIFCVGLISIAAYLFYDGRIRFNYPDRNEFPLLGIDISHHQGKIDWQRLREEKLSFVIVKATEGGDFKDPLFNENWKACKKEKYKFGAYRFYSFCKTGREQAQNFMDVVPFDRHSLPPTIDLEFSGNCKTTKTDSVLVSEVRDFLILLESYYRKRPMIYATMEFYKKYLLNDFKDYSIWIRDIYRQPKLEGRDWVIWQFANRAHLKGINTYVDLNVVNGKSLDPLLTTF
jgi:lysozyme